MTLMFYHKEQRLFPEAYNKAIYSQQAKIVFNKLIRHYKLNLRLFFHNRKTGWFKGWHIIIPYKTTYGLLCREISHAIDHKKRGKSKHDKKLMRILKQVISYCKKRDW